MRLALKHFHKLSSRCKEMQRTVVNPGRRLMPASLELISAKTAKFQASLSCQTRRVMHSSVPSRKRQPRLPPASGTGHAICLRSRFALTGTYPGKRKARRSRVISVVVPDDLRFIEVFLMEAQLFRSLLSLQLNRHRHRWECSTFVARFHLIRLHQQVLLSRIDFSRRRP